VDVEIYVIDVTSGEKLPRKGGPAIMRSDLLVITKQDLAESQSPKSPINRLQSMKIPVQSGIPPVYNLHTIHILLTLALACS
jgi:hypothetical protein